MRTQRPVRMQEMMWLGLWRQQWIWWGASQCWIHFERNQKVVRGGQVGSCGGYFFVCVWWLFYWLEAWMNFLEWWEWSMSHFELWLPGDIHCENSTVNISAFYFIEIIPKHTHTHTHTHTPQKWSLFIWGRLKNKGVYFKGYTWERMGCIWKLV